MEQQIILLQGAVRALQEASTVEEIKHVIDIASAAKEYARAAFLGRQAETYAEEISVRAERKLGFALKEMEMARGGALEGVGRRGKTDTTPQETRLSDLGISRGLSSRAQRMASLTDEDFSKAIDQASNSETSMRKAVLSEYSRQYQKAVIEASRRMQENATPVPSGEFDLVLADPPWRYDVSSPSRTIENQYPTMDTESIMLLCNDVLLKCNRDMFAKDCILFLWATSPLLDRAIDVMRAWGFTYKTSMVWVKEHIGMGVWARIRHELLLIGTRGNPAPPIPSLRTDSVIMAPATKHSKKPDVVYDIVEKAFPIARKLELFAREARAGWSSWGLEIQTEDSKHESDGN